MDLTSSYEQMFSVNVQGRYVLREVRNGSAIIKATNPNRFRDIEDALTKFSLLTSDLVEAGGQESKLAARLNDLFRERGWREARVDTVIKLALQRTPHRAAGEETLEVIETEVTNEGYKVDNMLDRIALDVEWNAKDGNLDRDISAYRSLYDAGLIDAAVIITRTLELRELGQKLGLEAGLSPAAAKRILNTTTTTNLAKLQPRLERGDSGGCPILVVAICDRTWDGFAIEPREQGLEALKEAVEDTDTP